MAYQLKYSLSPTSPITLATTVYGMTELTMRAITGQCAVVYKIQIQEKVYCIERNQDQVANKSKYVRKRYKNEYS